MNDSNKLNFSTTLSETKFFLEKNYGLHFLNPTKNFAPRYGEINLLTIIRWSSQRLLDLGLEKSELPDKD